MILCILISLPNYVLGVHSHDAARNGEYPSSVAVLNDTDIVAAGMLVTPIHVFTACSVVGYFVGHKENSTCDLVDGEGLYDKSNDSFNRTFLASKCLDFIQFRPFNAENVSLIAGSKWIYALEGGQTRSVGNSYVHPDCNIRGFEIIRYNVGVFEARERFYLTNNLQPISFLVEKEHAWAFENTPQLNLGTQCSVAGWGRTEKSNYSEWLLTASVVVVPDGKCIEQYSQFSKCLGDDLSGDFNFKGKLCVGNIGRDFPCFNDVGAGLRCNGVIYGILSQTNCSEGSFSIVDGVDLTVDLYLTVQREASEGESTAACWLMTASLIVACYITNK